MNSYAFWPYCDLLTDMTGQYQKPQMLSPSKLSLFYAKFLAPLCTGNEAQNSALAEPITIAL